MEQVLHAEYEKSNPYLISSDDSELEMSSDEEFEVEKAVQDKLNKKLDQMGLLDADFRATALQYVRDRMIKDALIKRLQEEEKVLRTEKGR